MNISVVITTFNRYALLNRALASVLSQTYKPSEIIVIDDGSTDNTKNITQIFPHVKYFHKKNSGISSARNHGIKVAKSEWIAFLDDDDEWCEEKLQIQAAFHKKHKNIPISFTDEIWIRDEKRVKVPKKYQKNKDDILQKCLKYCFLAPSSVMIKKELFDEVGYFDESLEVCEDYDMWIKIALFYQIGIIPKSLIIKNAGAKNQLGFKHWGMDRFRVHSLINIFHIYPNHPKRYRIKEEIVNKLTLLINGAKKHNNKTLYVKYSKFLKEFNDFN